MNLPPVLRRVMCAALLYAPVLHAETILQTTFDSQTSEGWQSYREPRRARLISDQSELEVSSSTAFRGTWIGLPRTIRLKGKESVALFFRFRLLAFDPEQPGAFRFGFFRFAPGNPEDADSDRGFFATLGGGLTGPLVAIQEDRRGKTFDPLSGNTRRLIEESIITPFEGESWHKASLTIRAKDDSTLKIDAQIDEQQISATQTTLLPADFGSVFIGSGNNNARFVLDDVTVSHTAQ